MSKGRGYTMTDKIIDISGRRRAKECDFAFTTGMMLKDANFPHAGHRTYDLRSFAQRPLGAVGVANRVHNLLSSRFV